MHFQNDFNKTQGATKTAIHHPKSAARFSSSMSVATQPHSKPIRSILKYFMLIIGFMGLLGCKLNYTSDHQASFTVEKAWVNPDLIDGNKESIAKLLNEASFEPFNTHEQINFTQQNQDVLLKISVDNYPAAVKEFTLSVFPKYLGQVSYFRVSDHSEISVIENQFRNRSSASRYYSSQKFAFNVDQLDINSTHYLYIHSENKRYALVEIIDANSYIKADAKFTHFFTMVYSIILAMVLFNAVFYLYNRDLSYLFYTVYMATALYSLLWQEGKINDLSWFAWQIMGNRSNLIYLFIADLAANLFFYRFMRLKLRKSIMVKLVLTCVVFRLGLILTALVQYHMLGALNYTMISALFNISVVLSSLLVWIIILKKTIDQFPQAKYLLVAWTLLIGSVVLRIIFSMNPHPDLIWMAHSYEIAIMLEGLILAFGLANRTSEFREQRDQAVSKYTDAERSIYKHQLITQFQQEIQELVKDPTLDVAEVAEKINIKFHLLINRAFPIKNSLLHIDKELRGICTTGLQHIDLDLLTFKLNEVFSTNMKNQLGQYEITTSDHKTLDFLYLPLSSEEFKNTRFVFGLKHNNPVNPRLMKEFRSFCEAAYTALTQAEQVHQVALAANQDSMTDCHNRSSIEKVIKESLKHAKRTTVAYIDLDNLKEINDQHGHHIGDQGIIEFSQLLKQCLNSQAKIGRVGGDEFIAVFSDVEFESCEEMLEDFMQQLSQCVLTEAGLTITSSIGLAESRLHETDKSLVQKADAALYHAKEQGRNQVTVYQMSMANRLTG